MPKREAKSKTLSPLTADPGRKEEQNLEWLGMVNLE